MLLKKSGRTSIEGFRKQCNQLQDQESQLVEKIASLETRKQELVDAIRLADRAVANNQCVTDRDLAYASDKYERCSKINKFRLAKTPDNTLEMSINGDVNIVIDQGKLSSKSPDAVLIRLLESRNQELGPLSELVHGLQVIAKDNWDMNEVNFLAEMCLCAYTNSLHLQDCSRHLHILESRKDDTA